METLLASQPDRFADLFVEVSAAYMEREHFASAVPWLRAAIESPEVRLLCTCRRPQRTAGPAVRSVALTRGGTHAVGLGGPQYNIALYWFRLAECYAKLDQHDLAIETYESRMPCRCPLIKNSVLTEPARWLPTLSLCSRGRGFACGLQY